MLGWLVGAALATEPVVLPASAYEITFDADASDEIAGALQDLATGAFASAGERFAALAEAGGGARIRYLEALAWYEGGEVHLAEDATDAGLKLAKSDGDLLALRGLILADLGQGTQALAVLDQAWAGSAGSAALRARIEIDRALVQLDRGDADAAGAALDRAQALADPDLQALIDADRAQVAALRGGTGAPDLVAAVGDRLSKGDVAGAKALIPKGTDARTQVRATLANGAIARAEGRFADAAKLLDQAASAAATHGLLREQAAALGQLGVVYGADNRWDAGLAALDRAMDVVTGTSFKLVERTLRIEAARAASEAGNLGKARQELTAAQAITVDDAAGAAALAEVQGVVAAKSGDRAGASAAYDRAMAAQESRGAWADAARVGCLRVELVAADPAALAAARTRALAAFSSAHDPLGPVHVGIAEGLGRASAKDLSGALTVFADASKAADAVGGARGQQLARIAKENAAKSLADLADSASVLKQADQWGLTELVAKAQSYQTARTSYDLALTDYNAGRYEAAYAGFDVSVKALEKLGEQGYERAARRGRAWSRFNASTKVDATTGYPIWQDLIEEGTMLGDAELRVRSMVAAALAGAEIGRPEALLSLRAAAAAAEGMGLRPQAGQCQGALVDAEPVLADKVAAARKAYALRDGDGVGVYALYDAAVAAYQAEDYALAKKLASEVLPIAGTLAPSVREVLDAARQSGG